MSVGEDKEAEPPLLYANRLSEEHLQLIFEIRQKQDDQCTLSASSTKEWTFCSMHWRTLLRGLDAQHVARSTSLSTTSMAARARPRSSASRFLFFVCSRRRLDGHGDQFHFVHTVLFIQFGHGDQIILFIQFCLRGDASNSKFLMAATCSGFPFVAEQVANRWHCTDISRN
jgi:hypothetical protein